MAKEDDKINHKDLKIPAQVSDRDDFIQGIGAKEIMVIIVTFIVLIFFVITGYAISKNLVMCFMIAAFLLGLSIISTKRNNYNENLIDQIKILRKYLKMQKVYEYKHTDLFAEYDNAEDKNAAKK